MIYINLGSLKSESVERLEDAGLLSTATEKDQGPSAAVTQSKTATTTEQGREVRGTPWFEEMIEGSELGRIRRRRGGEISIDGRMRTEWEVTEFEGDGAEEDGGGTGKRKHDSLVESDDVHMKS